MSRSKRRSPPPTILRSTGFARSPGGVVKGRPSRSVRSYGLRSPFPQSSSALFVRGRRGARDLTSGLCTLRRLKRRRLAAGLALGTVTVQAREHAIHRKKTSDQGGAVTMSSDQVVTEAERTQVRAAEASQQATRGQLLRAVVASTVGTSIEWYDFFLYGSAAALVFGAQYFPNTDPLSGQLLAFGTYFVGFAARPVGAAIFGHYGDRI